MSVDRSQGDEGKICDQEDTDQANGKRLHRFRFVPSKQISNVDRAKDGQDRNAD
jgi:hypothetical protein